MMRTSVIVFLLWLGMLAPRVWWVARWSRFASVEMRGPRWERLGSRSLSLGWQLLVLAYVAGSAPWGIAPDGRVATSGVLLALAAVALQWRAQVALGPNYQPDVSMVHFGYQVTTGPYRYLRHPIYVAVGLWILGIVLLTGSLVLGVGGAVFFAWLVVVRIPIEERCVRELFEGARYVGRF